MIGTGIVSHTGSIALYTGNFTEAERYLQEVNNIYREVGYKVGIASSNIDLGKLAFLKGDLKKTNLRHPAIPEVYDYVEAADYAYIVLEYIAGKDLEVMLEEQKGFLAVILRAVEHNPEDRHQSAEELKAACLPVMRLQIV